MQRNRSHVRELSQPAVSGVTAAGEAVETLGQPILHLTRVPHSCHEGTEISSPKSEGATVPSLQSAVSLQVSGV